MTGASHRAGAWIGRAPLVGILICASLVSFAAIAAGKTTAAPDAARRQHEAAAAAMSGFWQGIMEPEDEHFRRLGPSGGPNVGEFTGLHFTPEGLRKAQAWSPDDEYLPENFGRSQIVPTIMTTPFPIQLEFGRQHATIRITECDNVRSVDLSGEQGRAGATAASAAGSGTGTAMGISTGHWEGSTLVVRTTGIRAGQVRVNGAPQSPNAVATERYGLVGEYLVAVLTIEDPVYYTQPLVRVIAYRKRNDMKALEVYGSCS